MRRLLLTLALIAIPIQLQADTEAPAKEPAAAAAEIGGPEAAPAEDAPPAMDELLGQTGKVVNDWRTVGWLAGLIALVNLLINLLRIPALDTLLAKYKKKWLKPYIAAALGAILGGLSTYATNADILNSLVVGLMTGLAAIGVHEVANKRKAENRGA